MTTGNASLFGDRRAVVLDVVPVLTAAESLLSLTSAPVGAFEDLNLDSAREA